MSAPLAPPRLRPVVPRRCTADRDGRRCNREARMYAAGWRCAECRPGAADGRALPPPGPGWPSREPDTTAA